MTYAVKWRPKALDALRKLPRDVATRIVLKVDQAKANPNHFLDRLEGDPGYKLRVGDYRVIIDIIENERILAVRLVGHRRNIYKRSL